MRTSPWLLGALLVVGCGKDEGGADSSTTTGITSSTGAGTGTGTGAGTGSGTGSGTGTGTGAGTGTGTGAGTGSGTGSGTGTGTGGGTGSGTGGATGTGTGGGTGSGTGTGTGGGTGTGTGSGTGSGTGTGTGSPTCNLRLRVIARDPSGATCVNCPRNTDLTLVAKVENPCSGPLDFVTTSDCLVSHWEVREAGIEFERTETCTPGTTRWTVQPGQPIEATTNGGSYRNGAYVIDVTYEDASQTVVRGAFAIF